MRKEMVFSTIEWLMAVAIILIIAAVIAVPNLLRGSISANESAVVAPSAQSRHLRSAIRVPIAVTRPETALVNAAKGGSPIK